MKFSEVFNLQMGKTPARNTPKFWGGPHNWLSIGDIKGKYTPLETKEKISDSALTETGIKIVPKGTVVMSFKLSVGKASIASEDLYTNEAIMAFITKEGFDLNNEYLYYYLSGQNWAEGTNKAVKGKTLNKATLSQRSISIPSMDIQLGIVDRLNKLNDAIGLCNGILERLDDIVKSRFVEMFGDPEFNSFNLPIYRLDSLFDVGSSKRIYQSEQVSSGVPFLRIADLMERIETGTNSASLYISDEKYDELRKGGYVPSPGDILVTARGTLGSCYIIQENDKFYFQDGMISWMYNRSKKVNSIFIYYLFAMPGFKKQIVEKTSGSTVSYLSIAKLRELDIMLPKREQQDEFADFVSEVDKSKLAVTKCLKKAEYLKSALMQKYFG